MKTLNFLMALSLLSTAQMQKAAAEEPGGAADDKTDQALGSHDPKQVLAALPGIDKLWPQEPKKYADSVRREAEALGASESNSNVGARGVITDLFASLLAKPLPEDPGLAIECLRAKDDAVMYFLNFHEVREGKGPLIGMAKYIGDIRGRIIPDFVPKKVYANAINPFETNTVLIHRIIAENEKNKAINSFQQSLQTADTMLTFHLLRDASQAAKGDANNAEFINSIASAAHLTKDEQNQLKQ